MDNEKILKVTEEEPQESPFLTPKQIACRSNLAKARARKAENAAIRARNSVLEQEIAELKLSLSVPQKEKTKKVVKEEEEPENLSKEEEEDSQKNSKNSQKNSKNKKNLPIKKEKDVRPKRVEERSSGRNSKKKKDEEQEQEGESEEEYNTSKDSKDNYSSEEEKESRIHSMGRVYDNCNSSSRNGIYYRSSSESDKEIETPPVKQKKKKSTKKKVEQKPTLLRGPYNPFAPW